MLVSRDTIIYLARMSALDAPNPSLFSIVRGFCVTCPSILLTVTFAKPIKKYSKIQSLVAVVMV